MKIYIYNQQPPLTQAVSRKTVTGWRSELLPLQFDTGCTEHQTPHHLDGRASGKLVPQLDRLLKVPGSDGENQQVGALIVDLVGLLSDALGHRHCKVERQTYVVPANSDLAAGKGTWAFSPDICSAGG